MNYPQLQDMRFRAYVMAHRVRVSPLMRRHRVTRGVRKMLDGDITLPEFTALWPRLTAADEILTAQD